MPLVTDGHVIHLQEQLVSHFEEWSASSSASILIKEAEVVFNFFAFDGG